MNKDKNCIILEITDKDFDPDFVPSVNISDYKIRKASRGILKRNNAIALINITKENYHKLPGGGAEMGENDKDAFVREIMEETGCTCEIEDGGQITIECREKSKTFQISKIFFATVVGEPGEVKFEEDEIAEGATLEWIPISEIENVFANDNPKDYEGKFIHKRDKAILEYYKEKINGQN